MAKRRDGRRTPVVGAAALGLALAGREALARLREADLTGDAVLITGGSRGLGFLLARELAREGCRVAICARDERELERAREELEEEGAAVLALRCDVADQGAVERPAARQRQTNRRRPQHPRPPAVPRLRHGPTPSSYRLSASFSRNDCSTVSRSPSA